MSAGLISHFVYKSIAYQMIVNDLTFRTKFMIVCATREERKK